MAEKVRKHIYFSGRVQGVGFRYMACVYARELGLSGWVKNLHNGQVEMEVQGEVARIELLLDRLAHSFPIRIDHMQAWDLPWVEKEKRFGEVHGD